MHIVVVGLNYRTAPVEIREKFTFSERDLPDALHRLRHTKSISECVIVSTCNRTELYAVVDRLHVCGHYLRSFLEDWFGIDREQFTKYLYIYEDDQALKHLFRVASGLDSMIIGETQILGQVRDAFLFAQKQGTTGTLFNKLFKQAVTMAKRAHTETSINDNAVSVSYAAVELGKQIFGNFDDKEVLLIGAGKMSELTAKHLQSNGAKKLIVANRSYERAVELARMFNGEACAIEQMDAHLAEVDIVISSTGSDQYVLTHEQMSDVLKARKTKNPLFMIDIAVPRDIDPEIGSLEDVFLYDIDDLEGIVESNLEQRREDAMKIEGIIVEEIADFKRWFKTLGVGPVIRALQEKSAEVHSEVMQSLLNKLPDLNDREVKLIRKLTKSMVNQMLQDPIHRVKEMSAQRNGEEALRMFSELFALEDRIKQFESKSSAPKIQFNDSRAGEPFIKGSLRGVQHVDA